MKFITRLILVFIIIFDYAGLSGQQLAFPGAEGFGRFATGGRGGTVYHVTNLNDAGSGSFRDAVSQSNRIVVFDVSGVINISSRVVVSSNITIAGQTAPGDGVVIYGDGMSTSGASNVIVRYLRVRMGVNGTSGKDAMGLANGQNQIFDHISTTWGLDETFSISWDGKNIEPSNISITNSIIGQGLQTHSCGGLVQTNGGVSIIRCLYSDNKTRNPKVKGLNQFVNNVIYNWGSGGGYILGDSEGTSWATIVNNYFINGPSTTIAAYTRANENFQLYAAGNYVDGNKDGILNGTLSVQADYGPVFWVNDPSYWASVADTDPLKIPQMHPEVSNLITAEEAYYWVIDSVGAILPARDQVDTYMINEVLSLGTKGVLISNESQNGLTGNVGSFKGGNAPLDTDRDGMPDEWELYYGMDPRSTSDQNLDYDSDGYTNIEEYLNGTNPGNGSGALADGTYFIEVKHSEKVLDVDGASSVVDALIVQNEMLKAEKQAWKLENKGSGFFSIINSEGNLAVSVEGSSTADDANIIQSAYTGADNQLWTPNFIGEGYYSITNKNSNKSFTIASASMENSASLVQETYSNLANQKFKPIPYEFIFNPPVAAIEEPTQNSVFTLGEDIYIFSEVSDKDGQIKDVKFYDGTTLIGTDTIAPYRMVWTNAAAGSHSIKVVAVDDDDLTTTSSAIGITVVGNGANSIYIQEDELGYCGLEGTVDNNNAGFSGAGFCNTTNAVGTGINWIVNMPSAGSYTFTFRYANGSSTNRTGKLIVNGVEKVASVNFNTVASGDYTQWAVSQISVSLTAGINEIRLEALTSEGLANIDYLEINNSDVGLATCDGDLNIGKVYLEKYQGISGDKVDDLYYNTAFPASPNDSSVLYSLSSPFNLDDNYGIRIRGFIHSPITTKYQFWISGSNQCQFWLSVDTAPANAQRIAYVPGYTDIMQWDKYTMQQSEEITLVTGFKSYFEILLKASTGEDHVEVAWASSGAGIEQSIIGSAYISPWLDKTYKDGVVFTGIEKIRSEQVMFYPNPVNDKLYINVADNTDKLSVSIVSLNGEILVNDYFTNNIHEVNVENLDMGIYIVKLSGNKVFKTYKIIKQ